MSYVIEQARLSVAQQWWDAACPPDAPRMVWGIYEWDAKVGPFRVIVRAEIYCEKADWQTAQVLMDGIGPDGKYVLVDVAEHLTGDELDALCQTWRTAKELSLVVDKEREY